MLYLIFCYLVSGDHPPLALAFGGAGCPLQEIVQGWTDAVAVRETGPTRNPPRSPSGVAIFSFFLPYALLLQYYYFFIIIFFLYFTIIIFLVLLFYHYYYFSYICCVVFAANAAIWYYYRGSHVVFFIRSDRFDALKFVFLGHVPSRSASARIIKTLVIPP